MASLETTELKLKTTPTGGVEASHSPYYRRLLSAGYKGFLQGSIGGAALYGTFGLAIGALVALPLLAVPAVSTAAALAFIPIGAGLGIFKGASTFGQIGSVAAITAESSDLSEQRRYLLDRYYDLPEGPEGDREAAAIKQELLERENDTGPSPRVFHWRTVAAGALIGAAICLGVSGLFAANIITGATIEGILGIKLGGIITGLGVPALTSIGTALGALAGATIGIDRYYIRKWFDHTEGVVHSSTHHESALIERSEQVERLKAANRLDKLAKQQFDEVQPAAPTKPPAATTPSDLDKPVAQISAHDSRREGLLAIQKAMDIPVV